MSKEINEQIVQLLDAHADKAEIMRRWSGIRTNKELAGIVVFFTYILMDLEQRGDGNPFSTLDPADVALLNAVGVKPRLEFSEQAGHFQEVFAASKEAVLDEMPGAYKDLDEVMANQSDLVRTTKRLRPLGTYKGAEARWNKRDRARKWRPEEER